MRCRIASGSYSSGQSHPTPFQRGSQGEGHAEKGFAQARLERNKQKRLTNPPNRAQQVNVSRGYDGNKAPQLQGLTCEGDSNGPQGRYW